MSGMKNEESMKLPVRLLALDVDGTLFRSDGRVDPVTVRAICRAQEKGVCVVLASGRDYAILPFEQLGGIQIDYVITSNGGAAYRTSDRSRVYEECMDSGPLAETLEYILKQEVYLSALINDRICTPLQCRGYADHIPAPEHIRAILKSDSRNWVDDIVSLVQEPGARVQKVTMNFQQMEDGTYLNREKVKKYLEATGAYTLVNGGFSNLEFTRAGVSKVTGLRYLAEHLGIPVEQTMAMGDSENDSEMLRAAGIGVAMGNALDSVKAAADDVTLTNDEGGVACAIEKYILRD